MPLAWCLAMCATACHGGDARSYSRTPRTVVVPGGAVVLPCEWWCDYALIETTIDGRGPFAFMLDTGSDETIVTPELAARLPDSMFKHKRRVRGADGSRAKVSTALAIDRLIAGEAEFHRFDALVMDLNPISDALGRRLDGILGCPLFEGSLLVLDYPAREVRLRSGSLEGEKREDQFRVSGADRPFVPLMIDGRKIACLVDSGSGSGLSIPSKTMNKLSFQQEPVIASATVSISGEPRLRKAGRLTTDATIGPYLLRTPIVRASGKTASIGVKMLRHFVVTYDRHHGLVRFERSADEPITTAPYRTHGIVFRKRQDGWIVWQMLPFAKAVDYPLQVGDVVTRMDGRPVADLDCDTLREWTLSKKRIPVDISRKGWSVKGVIRPVDLIP